MANLKNASIREMVIDKCLSDRKRRYSTKDIMEACNRVLDIEGYGPVTSLNTIRSDMQAIESRWHAYGGVIVEEKCGRNKYYYYKKEGFSIYHAGLTEEELSKLNETIQVLSRFKGLPQFECLEELSTRFKSSFMATPNCEAIINFEDNRHAEGKQYISLLFEAITQKQVLNISYQPFDQETPAEQEIHPYYLKEYNNRWFLFGLDSRLLKLSTLALDRIKEVRKSDCVYIENTRWNFGEYFEDVIGVSVKQGKKAEPIKLWVDGEQYNYIKTKPLHGSQRVIERREDNSMVIQIEVQENYELYQKLLSFGEKVVVLEPERIRKKMQERIWIMKERYDRFR